MVKLRRYYTTLLSNSSFKKRVSWVESQAGRHVAVVEYSCLFSGATLPHGNSKGISNPYVHTHPKVMARIKEEVKHNVPKKAFKRLLDEANTSSDLPRNNQQIENARARVKLAGKSSLPKATMADEMLQVFAILLI